MVEALQLSPQQLRELADLIEAATPTVLVRQVAEAAIADLPRGHLYVTSIGGIWVFDATGKALGVIAVPEQPANLAWGDGDWRTLYITARTSLYRLRLKVPGIPVGSARRQ